MPFLLFDLLHARDSVHLMSTFPVRFKVKGSKEVSLALIDRNGLKKNIHTVVFHSISSPVCYKSTKSRP